MAFIGYARVSKNVQNVNIQLDSLKIEAFVYLHLTAHWYPLKPL
jgi:hypothetical protein